jgi:NAD(P)-dependent dehydrogenase (short-subunit alcohol dehydrogenase family)
MTESHQSADRPVAVVTGAAGGVGQASVRALLAAGMRVVLTDQRSDLVAEIAAGLGGDAVGLACDVADEASVARLFQDVADRFGRLDVLHSNAAIFRGHGTGLDAGLDVLDLATWNQTLAVNLTGAYLCSRFALPLLLLNRGTIVFTASVSGVFLGSDAPAYAASKAGLVGLTRALAYRYSRAGVRVNAICPGPINTDMSVQVRTDASLRDRLVQTIPNGRVAEPEDVANVVAFLCSPQASYLTGAIIPVEGGLTLA